MTKEQFKAKKQARIDRLKTRAANAKQLSTDLFDQSSKMADCIPFGQPILVGHHSERGDRNFRAKITRKMDQACKAQDKAEYYEQKAASAENNRSISSDDPEAIQKLETKISQLESNQSFMKKVNNAHAKYIKNQDESVLSEFDEKWQLKIKNYVPPYSWEKHPFPPYALQNNNQNISACKKRLESLKQSQVTESSEKYFGDIKLIENADLNRIQIIFPGKPDQNTRTHLKNHGFRWAPSEMAWQRQLNNSGRYAAELVINQISKNS